MQRFYLPSLNYSETGLKSFLSPEAMSFHYGKHHQKYVDQTNKLIQASQFADASLEKIILEAEEGELLNNASQAWNHTLYWNCLSERGFHLQGEMSLSESIDEAFGNFTDFKELFSHSATKLFGSGWTWLVSTEDGQLKIVNTKNGGNPLRDGQLPILCCDVWEHAYYVDFRNRREDYVKKFWDHVNWSQVDAIFNDRDVSFIGKMMEAAPAQRRKSA